METARDSDVSVVSLELQRRRDLLFLALLLLMLSSAAFAVVRSAYPPRLSTAGRSHGGKIRRIEPAELRGQLKEGRLSRHEADHYRRAGEQRQP